MSTRDPIIEIRPGAGDADDPVSLCDALDRLLHKGVVVKGEIAISVADVPLVYLGAQILLASIDTARDFLTEHQA